MLKVRFLTVATAIVLSPPAMAQDPNAGKATFSAQCGLCHSAEPGDNGGAQGPSLQGVFGREAASSGAFTYTRALQNSGLSWDAATLDRFLASPTSVVPGSSMVVPLASDSDRANVIAYFESLKAGTFEERQGPAGGFAGFGGGEPPALDPNADWLKDYPGRVHSVDLDSLPEPYASNSAVNFPTVVEQPGDQQLQVPAGFKVALFTDALTAPRGMIVAANGDVFVAETTSGRIKVMRPDSSNTAPASIATFAQGLIQPLGLALYPDAANPEWLYVAENNRVVRYPYSTGDMVASGVPELVVPELSPVSAGHYTRDLAFSPDRSRMYVSVGSQSNVAEDIPAKSPDEIQAWEAERGLGAAWGAEENRASVMVYEVGNEASTGKLFATGIRNCVGLTVQPETGDVWCSVNERDQLGDDLVPDYSTRVTEGGFYGWPWYYMGDNEDPRHAGARPDLPGNILRPDVPYTSHSAAVDLEFYPYGMRGESAFPAEYSGQGFAVLHGSWNRANRTGHKVVQVPIVNGEPTGEYIDFLVGFIAPSGNPWGRPVAITVMNDGSLLLSDDGANRVYRIYFGD